ncbi:MAG TPA: L-ribulose-5-phosphate 3-epimerase [Spirochaetia bacterium]|nr:L-ribulose-5-phosphate 3-epimerase [Spirochaetia bacterium]
MPAHRWGIYEKALPADVPWPRRLQDASRAGYQFIEISIDESEERVARLDWPRGARQELRRALADAPVSIDSLCLSAHRRYALGSASAGTRQQARDIMRKAIELAAELGIRVVQVAGYDVFYEPSTSRTRALYREAIREAAEWARAHCVMLALENVDRPVVDSVQAGMELVRAADTPWLQMYPDIGNLTALQKDVPRELAAGGRHIVGVHLKDTRVGEFRRVPFGEGIVDFPSAFRVLDEIGYAGPFVVEMWNEAAADPLAVVADARRWLEQKLASAGT